MWDRATWQINESPVTVRAYMEQYLPPAEERSPGRWYSGLCDESALARWVSNQINGDRYPWYTEDNVPLPCVSVVVKTEPNAAGLTEYDIWAEWPAP